MPPPRQKRPRAERESAGPSPFLTTQGVARLITSSPGELSDADLPVLQVVSLHRLALDPKWLEAMGATPKDQVRPELADAFDVILSDGAHKAKCVLSTTLNGKSYSGWLQPRVLVRIMGWRRVIDERIEGDTQPPPLIIITGLRAFRWPPEAGAAEPDFPKPFPGLINPSVDGGDLTFHPQVLRGSAEAQARQMEALPLLGVRKHYLRLDSDEVLLTERWMRADDEQDRSAQRGGDVQQGRPDVPSLDGCPPLARAKIRQTEEAEPRAHNAPARVLADGQKRRQSSKQDAPTLIGRVARVGPLHFYGGLHGRFADRTDGRDLTTAPAASRFRPPRHSPLASPRTRLSPRAPTHVRSAVCVLQRKARSRTRCPSPSGWPTAPASCR